MRKLREARGWTQEQLEGFGLSWRTVQSIESGTTTDPRLSTILKLCHAFNVTVDELLGLPRGT